MTVEVSIGVRTATAMRALLSCLEPRGPLLGRLDKIDLVCFGLTAGTFTE